MEHSTYSSTFATLEPIATTRNVLDMGLATFGYIKITCACRHLVTHFFICPLWHGLLIKRGAGKAEMCVVRGEDGTGPGWYAQIAFNGSTNDPNIERRGHVIMVGLPDRTSRAALRRFG